MPIRQSKLTQYLNILLRPKDWIDYCPNGLQIEGKEEVQKIAFAVSATRESIGESVEWGADALVVHHGLFWKFHGPKTITGPFAKRVRPLIQNDINLYGYHLPLDAHLEIGNAASVANKVGLTQLAPFGDYKKCPTGVKGIFNQALEANELIKILEKELGHSVIHSDSGEKVKSLGIITGGANSGWMEAHRENLDAYLTGEISEHDWHEAKEAGVHMFAGGHHATEKWGIQSLKEKLEIDLKLETKYFDSENPA